MNDSQECSRHKELWEAHYPGRFCIYCGREIARLEAVDGQLALKYPAEAPRETRYVAVVHQGRQHAVAQLSAEKWPVELELQELPNKFRVSSEALLLAFQDSREVLYVVLG